jgi:hypothetical protein
MDEHDESTFVTSKAQGLREVKAGDREIFVVRPQISRCAQNDKERKRSK